MRKVRNHLTGARIAFNGREEDTQIAVDRYGRPLIREELIVLVHKPWRWRVDVKMVLRRAELVKIVDDQIETQQSCLLNDLTDTVAEWKTLNALDNSGWQVDRVEWVAKVIA
jgi:hypothetical protein